MCPRHPRTPKESRVSTEGHLVDLLDGGTVVTTGTGGGTGARSTAGHAAGHATSTTVELHHDGVGNGLKLLLLLLVLLARSLLALVEPSDGLVNLGLESLLVAGVKLLVDLGVRQGVAERVGVRLKAVLGRNTGTLSLVLLLVLLGLSQHALNLLLGQAALVVGDDDLVGLAGALLQSRDVHDTVGINIEGNLDLGDTTGGGRNAGKLELAKQVVVLFSSQYMGPGSNLWRGNGDVPWCAGVHPRTPG